MSSWSEEITGRLLDHEYVVCVEDARVAAAVRSLLVDSVTEDVSDPDVVEIVGRLGERLELRSPGGGTIAAESVDVLLPFVAWRLNQRVHRTAGSMPLLHAGGVVDERGRGVLLIGEAHAGKSTTTVGLASSGLAYLSDDVVGVHADGTVRGSCKPVSLRAPSVSVLGLDRAATLPGAFGHSDGSAGSLTVAASALGLAVARSARVRVVVLISRELRVDSIEQITRAQLLHELVGHCLNCCGIGVDGFERLAALAAGSTGLKWGRGSVDQLTDDLRVRLSVQV